jgi:DNA polymerase (family 10)
MALTNQEIAQKLREHATELARTGSNLYRVRAFRSAAMAVMGLPREVAELVAKGDTRMLERTPGIGKSLADTIARYSTGQTDSPPERDLSAGRSVSLTAA